VQAVLVKKEGGVVSMKDGFDTGVNTRNDKVFGGMVGALVGVLGGPIGVLLGGRRFAVTCRCSNYRWRSSALRPGRCRSR
jgi:hypothetical protein